MVLASSDSLSGIEYGSYVRTVCATSINTFDRHLRGCHNCSSEPHSAHSPALNHLSDGLERVPSSRARRQMISSGMAKKRRIAAFLALSAAVAATALASKPSTDIDRADSRAGHGSDGQNGEAARETGAVLSDQTDPESCGGPTSSVATLRVVHITDVYTLANFPHLAELIRQERECRECTQSHWSEWSGIRLTTYMSMCPAIFVVVFLVVCIFTAWPSTLGVRSVKSTCAHS